MYPLTQKFRSSKGSVADDKEVLTREPAVKKRREVVFTTAENEYRKSDKAGHK